MVKGAGTVNYSPKGTKCWVNHKPPLCHQGKAVIWKFTCTMTTSQYGTVHSPTIWILITRGNMVGPNNS